MIYAGTIIVFDHHRQSSEPITGAVLSYVDPYASSAAEMITEMIQYVEDGVKIKAFEADATVCRNQYRHEWI